MQIYYIGKFGRIWDEECIARSFESLGHTVIRAESIHTTDEFLAEIKSLKPDLVLFAKLQLPDTERLLSLCKLWGIPTVCWVFDIFFGYWREAFIGQYQFFKADYVFTTDGGHDKEFGEKNINHFTLRQGIYEPEAFLGKPRSIYPHEIVFVGCENGDHPYRQEMLQKIQEWYGDRFHWYGRHDTHEIRSTQLNELFASAKIVIGDSVFSPHYWSNRVYETIGRGGMLIHPMVQGLEQEFIPGEHFVPYHLGDFEGLKKKIDYYLKHDAEREKIRQAGFEYCKKMYTYTERCKTLITTLKNTGMSVA